MSERSTWHELIEAHQRIEHEPFGQPPTHARKAAVLACSDARVPPSVIFDQPAGSLFVVRIAGNTAVINTVDELTAHAGPMGASARAGRLEIRGAVHDLLRGRLVPIENPQTPTHTVPETLEMT